MNWILVAVCIGLLIWNVDLGEDRDYLRDLAESKDLANERENNKLIRMVNRPKRRAGE